LAGASSDGADVGRARLAVLIDADNAQASLVGAVLAEVATLGAAQVKRAYGDWTGSALKSWKEHLLAQSILPVQQFAYVSGKNATDAAMVIDAMDLLYRGRLDGFCLVSSDSDFTRLAVRLRESGRAVYGFGERKTPRPFVAACNKFVYVENLVSPPARVALPVASDADVSVGESPAPRARPAQRATSLGARLRGDTALVQTLLDAVEEASGDDGWASQAYVGHLINRRLPDFDPRTYDCRKLGELIAAIGLFDIDRRAVGPGKPAAVYLHAKRRPGPPASR